MKDISNRNSDNFGAEGLSNNTLWQYVQSLNPDAVGRLSQPSSPEVYQAIERTIVTMLGGLPSEEFNVTISTSRENLGRMLASAMLNGYFLRNVEQRLEFEKSLQFSESDSFDAM